MAYLIHLRLLGEPTMAREMPWAIKMRIIDLRERWFIPYLTITYIDIPNWRTGTIQRPGTIIPGCGVSLCPVPA